MIEKEIEKARRLYAAGQNDLSLQKGITGDLTRYRRAIALTYEQMGRAGVIQA